MTADDLARPARGRKRRFGHRRELVLRTAARIFSEQGYRQTTLDDIASALDMTRPALYYYANSKEELLGECAEVARVQLDQALDDADAQKTGLEKIRTFFRAHLASGCDDFGRCMLLVDEKDMAEERRQASRAWERGRNRRIEAMLRVGVSDGSFASLDTIAVRRLLFAMFNTAPLWVRAKTDAAVAKAADEILETFLRGLAPR